MESQLIALAGWMREKLRLHHESGTKDGTCPSKRRQNRSSTAGFGWLFQKKRRGSGLPFLRQSITRLKPGSFGN